mmetsp:Transcript_47377/g.122564  ORF Transcript_47377/g.122564 Transcript_47377/m.122564 type:complete len:273 (-) Transcript_47377:287-1105(-)
MLGTSCISSNERKVDLSLHGGRQLNLSLFSGLTEPLYGKTVFAEINTLFFLELGHQVIQKACVKVFTTKECVSVGSLHFENSVGHLKDGDIESTTTKIVHGKKLLVLVHSVSKSGSCGLVDDSCDIKASNATSILSGSSLAVVEVRRHRDDGILYVATEMSLSSLLHFSKNKSSDLSGGVLLTLSLYPGVTVGSRHNLEGNHFLVLLCKRVLVTATNQTLCGIECVFRVGHSLTLGWDTDKLLAVVCESNNRGSGPHTLSILNHFRVSTLDN